MRAMTIRAIQIANQRPDPPGAEEGRRRLNEVLAQVRIERRERYPSPLSEDLVDASLAWQEARIAELMGLTVQERS